MQKIGYDGYRFPPEIIQHAVWLYLRVTLSFRDAFAKRRSRAAATRRQTRRRISHVFPMHLNQNVEGRLLCGFAALAR
jgi:putative transposase